MAIFKPSNMKPSLSEIDVTQGQEFECQVNTSGEPVLGYKIQILSQKDHNILYDGNHLDTTYGIQNKKILKIPVSTTIFENSGIKNGKDYQWNVRVYNQTKQNSATLQTRQRPNTKICDGSVAGSTKYVIWALMSYPDYSYLGISGAKLYSSPSLSSSYIVYSGELDYLPVSEYITNSGKDLNFGMTRWNNVQYYVAYSDSSVIENPNKKPCEQIVYDRYIEFTNKTESDIIIGAKDDDTVQMPTGQYTERQKIDWVEKNLGSQESYVKIETSEKFKYNYKDGTTFNIYQCSDKHTVNSLYADPNSSINIADWIVVYDSPESAEISRTMGTGGPDEGTGIIFSKRKINGYSIDTGEIRVFDTFDFLPANGQAYRIFRQNLQTLQYTEVFASNLIYKIVPPSGSATIPYYNTSVSSGSYYATPDFTESPVGTLSSSVPCQYINNTYSIITMGSNIYYMQTGLLLAGNITSEDEDVYGITSINSKVGTFLKEEKAYDVPFSHLIITNSEGESVSNIYNYQLVGGKPISSDKYRTLQNKFSSSVGPQKIFIQPNINIKTDDDNPPEIVFENGDRIIIKKHTTTINGETIDDTFNKLDDSQWLLERITSDWLIPAESGGVWDYNFHMRPQENYSVYTDFMDSSPDEVFYARRSPVLTLQYLNDSQNWEDISSLAGDYINQRNISFNTEISNSDNQGIKYYQYFLYSGKQIRGNIKWSLVSSSREIYSSVLQWQYSGLLSGEEDYPQKYKVGIKVTDEYGKTFEAEEEFGVYYDTTQLITLNTIFECDKNAIRIEPVAPFLIYPQFYQDYNKIDSTDLHPSQLGNYDDYIEIPSTKVLLYDRYEDNGQIKQIKLPENFSFLTQFQITKDFVNHIPLQGASGINYSRVFSIKYNGVKNENENENNQAGKKINCLTLILYNFDSYSYDSSNQLIFNPNRARFQFLKKSIFIDEETGAFISQTEETPVNCFDSLYDPSVLVNSIPLNATGGPFFYPESYRYGIQEKQKTISGEVITQYSVLNAEDPLQTYNEDTKYIFTNSPTLRPDVVYYYSNRTHGFYPDKVEYVYINNVSDLDGIAYSQDLTTTEKYDILNVPIDCRGANGNLNWGTFNSNKIWVDNQLYSNEDIKSKLPQHGSTSTGAGNWFSLYLTVVQSDVESIRCEIHATQNERWGGLNE